MKEQYNKISGLSYQGKNQTNLLTVKKEKNFSSNAWITFIQAREQGLKIKKGSKAVGIFKGFGKVERKTKDDKVRTKNVPMGFAYVFNLDQTEKYILA